MDCFSVGTIKLYKNISAMLKASTCTCSKNAKLAVNVLELASSGYIK